MTAIPLPSGRIVVGFNFGQNSVRIACAKMSGGGKAEIVGVRTCNIEGLTDEAAANALKEAVKEFKVRKPVFVSSVDSPSIITKNIEIPSVKDSEIREIIDLQAGRYTPYGRGEIIVDYINIGTYHNSYTKALIVIIVQEIVKKQFSILDKAGFMVSKIQFSSESVGCVCVRALSLTEKTVPSILVSIDNKTSDFIILFKGKTVFVRTIPLGYESFEADRSGCEPKFIEEIKKSLDAYRAEDIENVPDELMFIGPADMVDTVKVKIAQGFGMPARNAMLYGNVTFSKEMLGDNRQLSFTNAIAGTLSYVDTKIDLRPSDLKMKAAFQERGREIIKSGIFLMAIIVMVCIIMLGKVYFKGVYLSKLDAQMKVMTPQVEDLEKISNKIMIIRRFLENKKRPLDIVSELYELVPEDVYLKGVTADDKGEINIKGTANAMSEVFSLVNALESSKYFRNASAQNTASRKEGGKDVFDFEITCKLEGKSEPKAEEKAASKPGPAAKPAGAK